MSEMGWLDKAACRSVGGVFYETEEEKVVKAKAICNTSAVRVNCLTYALAHRERYGVWGGMTSDEREEVLKSRLVNAS